MSSLKQEGEATNPYFLLQENDCILVKNDFSHQDKE